MIKEQQRFKSEKILNEYITTINKKIEKQLKETEDELKRNVHLLKGIQTGTMNIDELINTYIKDIESKKDVKFVIFDTNLNIIYGRNIIRGIEKLIFNQDNETYLGLTLLYLSSQGESTSFEWRDDIKQTIQLSYFEKSFDRLFFIGAFSYVDYQERLILRAFLNSIRGEDTLKNSYFFWIYDKSKKSVYNLNNKKKWQIATNIYNSKRVFYSFKKYNIYIGITTKPEFLKKKIEAISKKYENQFLFNVLLILIIGIVLISFAAIFSSYIKDIFASYNSNYEKKNRQLQRLKHRYELAIIASNDGLWDRNLTNDEIFFSKKWLEMLGYKNGEIRSYNDWLNLLHPKDRKKIEKIIKEYIDSKEQKHLICEYRLKMKNGKYKWILARGKVFDDKNTRRLLMMTMDIDDKKETTKYLKELVEKEVAKNEEKQKLLIQQNKLAAMGEMIGAIAHQWRQPLNNISLIIHFIRDNLKNSALSKEQLSSFVKEANEQIIYMSQTIDDFRNFYKPSKEKHLFSINRAIYSTIDIMQTQIKADHIRVQIQGNEVFIEGYENEFKQAILNILSNARDAIVSNSANTEGKIKIKIFKKNREIIITIFNNGGNIQSNIIDRIFEPYFTTKFETKGTGIGLYMTKTIIETSMKGEVFAKNEEDGVLFTIKLHS